MKLKTTLFALGMAAVAVGIVGCSGGGSTAPSDNKTAEKTPAAGGGKFTKKEMKIALIAKSSTNPVFQSALTGAQAAADELTKSTGVKITIDWLTPPTEDGQVQAQNIAQAVNQGDDAILISCSDAGKVTGAINDAVAKNVPVMTFDSDAPDSKRFAFYGVDDQDTGKQVVDQLAKVTGGKGNVAILAGNQNAPNLQKRVKGAQDEIAAKYPDMKVVGVFNHIETPQDAANEVIKDMKANPQINAWAMIGGWPLFTQSLLDLDPNKVKIVAVDALPAELAYVEKGIAPVLLAQPTYNWGYNSVHIIVDKIINGKDVPVINKMDLVEVNKDTLGDWARQLKAWKFDGIDPKYLALPPAKK